MPPESPKSILVVEDDEVAGMRLQTILEAHNYDVILVTDARQALDRLHAGLAPNVILLDMILPGYDGWQFFGARQRQAICAAAPVIVMTGLGIASREWALALGAVDFLRKPLNLEELLEKLQVHGDGNMLAMADGAANLNQTLHVGSGAAPPAAPDSGLCS